MIEQEYQAKTFVTWKWRWMGFNWMNRGTVARVEAIRCNL